MVDSSFIELIQNEVYESLVSDSDAHLFWGLGWDVKFEISMINLVRPCLKNYKKPNRVWVWSVVEWGEVWSVVEWGRGPVSGRGRSGWW